MKIYILTCKSYPLGNTHLEKLADFLKQKGYETSFIIWQELNLQSLDEKSLLLPLAVWDYSQYLEAFQNFLQELKLSKTKVFNHINLVANNTNKLYLKELENKGLDIINSIFLKADENWQEKLLKLKSKDLIIKPLVGQGGKGVRKFSLEELKDKQAQARLKTEFQNAALVQDYIKDITKGEFCFVFFNAHFAYAIKREVARGEWRANSKFQAKSYLCENYNEKCLELAYKAIQSLELKPLYARVDMILNENKPLINELELIEPNLYFDYKNGAINSFYEALRQRI